jgi:hypothetical protein
MSIRSSLILSGILVVTPAFAAQFYIVQDIKKQSCTVSEETPKDDDHVIVGEGAYGDEASAVSDLKKMLACMPPKSEGE